MISESKVFLYAIIEQAIRLVGGIRPPPADVPRERSETRFNADGNLAMANHEQDTVHESRARRAALHACGLHAELDVCTTH
jgi:hypothetical protein